MADGDMPSMPDPIFNRLLKDRIIWMGEEVKDDMANRICAQMLMLAAEDPKKDIWLYINSPGGSITAGMAIYDTMQLIQPDVATNAELIMDMKKTMSELTAEQTGHTVEEIYRDNEYDHWFTATEALEYGFVDKIITTHDSMTKGE